MSRYDLSLSIFQAVKTFTRPRLKVELENLAIDLVVRSGSVVTEQLGALIKIAQIADELSQSDADIFYQRIDTFRREFSTSESEKQNFPISGTGLRLVASGNSDVSGGNSILPVITLGVARDGIVKKKDPELLSSKEASHTKDQSGIETNVTERMNAIVKTIRKFDPILGGCRIRDLMTAFPDVSDRTLRYDLQRLAEQGIVEKVGGGPSSYYRLKKEGGSVQENNSISSQPVVQKQEIGVTKRNQEGVFTL